MKLSDFTNLSGQFVKPSGEGFLLSSLGIFTSRQVIRKSSPSIRLRMCREKLPRAYRDTAQRCRL